MSAEQAVAALRPDAELMTPTTVLTFDGNTFFPDPDVRAVQRRYEINGRLFVAYLRFGDSGLTRVDLTPHRSVPSSFVADIKQGLVARWGKPIAENHDACKPRGTLNVNSEQHEDRWDTAATSVALSYWTFCDPSSVFMTIRYGRGSGELAKRL